MAKVVTRAAYGVVSLRGSNRSCWCSRVGVRPRSLSGDECSDSDVIEELYRSCDTEGEGFDDNDGGDDDDDDGTDSGTSNEDKAHNRAM